MRGWWSRRTEPERFAVLCAVAAAGWLAFHLSPLFPRLTLGLALGYTAVYSPLTALGVLYLLRRRRGPRIDHRVAPTVDEIRAGSVAWLFDTWQRRHAGVAVPGDPHDPDADRAEAIRAALLAEFAPDAQASPGSHETRSEPTRPRRAD